MPESNLHGYCVISPQILSQEEFQELRFVPDPVLGDDGTYRNSDALIGYFKNSEKKKKKKKDVCLCVYCNLTDPFYNSPSVFFPHVPRYIHKTKQKMAIRRKGIKKCTRFAETVANFSFLFPLWIQNLCWRSKKCAFELNKYMK